MSSFLWLEHHFTILFINFNDIHTIVVIAIPTDNIAYTVQLLVNIYVYYEQPGSYSSTS